MCRLYAFLATEPSRVECGLVRAQNVDCLRRLLARCAAEGGSPPALNFVLTDGRRLLASRCNESLEWVERRERHRCEVCGACHCPRCLEERPGNHSAPYRAVVVASEPMTEERWNRVPDRHVLAVDEGLSVRLLEL